MRTFLARLGALLRRHIELTVIVPLLLATLALAWGWTWWRGLAVIELGPILADYGVGLLAVVVLGYAAWRFRVEYWHDLSDEDEQRLHAEAERGNRWAFWLLVKDRLEFLLLLAVLAGVFAVFSGHANAGTLARELIVRWEVSSSAVYTARYQHPLWPGGASGITWGVGYDGGHQPAHIILLDWQAHAQRDRLATTAGVIGERARSALPAYRDIRTDWALAIAVLDRASLPRYRALARQAYGPAFERQAEPVQAALISETYNRGPGMAGARRAERRTIRDVCLPARDAACVAQQLAASCRVWATDPINGPGLCARRHDEAAVARGQP